MYLCNLVALLFLLLYLCIFASFNLVWLFLTISHFLYFMTFLTVSQYCSQNFHNLIYQLIYQSKLFRCEVPRFGIYYCFSLGTSWFRGKIVRGILVPEEKLYGEKLYRSILLVYVCKIPVFFDLSISFRPKRGVPIGRKVRPYWAKQFDQKSI